MKQKIKNGYEPLYWKCDILTSIHINDDDRSCTSSEFDNCTITASTNTRSQNQVIVSTEEQQILFTGQDGYSLNERNIWNNNSQNNERVTIRSTSWRCGIGYDFWNITNSCRWCNCSPAYHMKSQFSSFIVLPQNRERSGATLTASGTTTTSTIYGTTTETKSIPPFTWIALGCNVIGGIDSRITYWPKSIIPIIKRNTPVGIVRWTCNNS